MENAKHVMVFKVAGILLISLSLLLIYQSFSKSEFDMYGNKIVGHVKDKYAITDGIGVEYKIKENTIVYTSPQVFSLTLVSLLVGFAFILKTKLMIQIVSNKFHPHYFLGYYLLLVIIGYVVYRFYMYFFYTNFLYSLLFGVIFLIVFLLVKDTFSLYHSDKFIFVFLVICCLYQGIGVVVELGNHFAPLYIHEGNWGLVDGNSIVVYDNVLSHNWTLGYVLFRIGNILLLLTTSLFLFKVPQKHKKKVF